MLYRYVILRYVYMQLRFLLSTGGLALTLPTPSPHPCVRRVIPFSNSFISIVELPRRYVAVNVVKYFLLPGWLGHRKSSRNFRTCTDESTGPVTSSVTC